MFSHDIHTHTRLSLCAKPDALPETYLSMCADEGLTVVGFSDHFWDSSVPGASDFYVPQNFEHVKKLAEMLPEIGERHGVTVLSGIECEFLGGDRVSVPYEVAKSFDFILVPPDHFHMAGFTRPADLTDSDGVRKLLIERFNEAVALKLPVPFSIAHPFAPLGYESQTLEIVSGISDAQYRDSFARAAENGVAVELQFILLTYGEKFEGMFAEEERMVKLAKSEGCKFTLGSDAHTPSSFTRHQELFTLLEKWGVTDADIADFIKKAGGCK